MKTIRPLVMALTLLGVVPSTFANAEVSGVSIDDTAIVGDQKLQLNGAGYRKRGYFKIDVTALYLPQKMSALEAIESATIPRRIELVILQDITGSQASRYFLIDFEASATPAEFSKLITEVGQVGDIYSSLSRIKKGDVITMDWVPAKGLIATYNGAPLTPHGASSPYINSELLGKVMLRMYVGGKTPAELRENLLGLSSSMRDKK